MILFFYICNTYTRIVTEINFLYFNEEQNLTSQTVKCFDFQVMGNTRNRKSTDLQSNKTHIYFF